MSDAAFSVRGSRSVLTPLRHGFDRAVEIAAVGATLAMLGTVVVGVVTRALDDPAIWTDELARYLLVWVACLGWIVASRRRVHIRITVFLNMLPAAIHGAAEAAIQAAVALFGVLLAVKGVELVWSNYDLEATAMPVSTAWLYAPLVLVGAVVAVQAGAQIADRHPDRASRSVGAEGPAE